MSVDLSVSLGRLMLANPILLASGTAGYLREMQPYMDLGTLGGVIPKTVTPRARPGNRPPRTVETASGLLNSIGLDNDGVDHFCEHHLPFLSTLGTNVIANIAAKTVDEFAEMAAQVEQAGGANALELNVSCPNVSGGVDFGTNPDSTAKVVEAVRGACGLPVIAKLTPNVTSVVPMAEAAQAAGADAVSLVNTFQGMAVDWRRRRPVLGNNLGGLSGPAIKPLALRIVWQVSQALPGLPIVGVGGVQSLDDVMEFLVAGASAVQVGTANFYNPSLSATLVTQLAETLTAENVGSVGEVVGTLEPNPPLA